MAFRSMNAEQGFDLEVPAANLVLSVFRRTAPKTRLTTGAGGRELCSLRWG